MRHERKAGVLATHPISKFVLSLLGFSLRGARAVDLGLYETGLEAVAKHREEAREQN